MQDTSQHGYVYAIHRSYCHPVTGRPGLCRAHVLDPANFESSHRCDAPAITLTVDARDLERRHIEAAYCDAHGGVDRALEDLRNDWMVQAPPIVGGYQKVLVAGNLSLDSRHAYLVTRPAEAPGKWLAWVGIGGSLTPVPNPEGGSLDRFGMKALRSHGEGGVPTWRGLYMFSSEELATQVGEAFWLRGVRRRVAEIRLARGDTLDWGVAVKPRETPQIIHLDAGDNAWDAVEELAVAELNHAITWQSPSGDTITVTPQAETILRAAKRWPKDASGAEYCSVSRGLDAVAAPTFTAALAVAWLEGAFDHLHARTRKTGVSHELHARHLQNKWPSPLLRARQQGREPRRARQHSRDRHLQGVRRAPRGADQRPTHRERRVEPSEDASRRTA